MTEATQHSCTHECKGSHDRIEMECIICTQVKEKYKKNMLEEIERKKTSLNQEVYHNSDEYFANLYYLIDIKTETELSPG